MYRFYTRVLILGTVLTITLILTTVMLDYRHRNRMLAIEDARLNEYRGMYIHFPKLSARGFKENLSSVVTPWDWEYYRAVREVLRVSSTVDPDTDGIPDIARESLNPNVAERGKFQQKRMSRFCELFSLPTTLPAERERLKELFWYLLYDDSKRMVFCYVPKVGCSSMKRIFMIVNGTLPPESSLGKKPPESILKRETNRLSDLPVHEALYRLKNYYKFTIVRNPLVRLLSAYINKIMIPIDNEIQPIFGNDKFGVSGLNSWMHRFGWNSARPAKVLNFTQFLTYMTTYPIQTYDAHFRPSLDICFPCAIRYDFHANFKLFDQEIKSVLKYLDIPQAYIPHSSHPEYQTEDLLGVYYKPVPHEQKRKLFETFFFELQFYYHLYPEEMNMHLKLMV